MELAPSTTMTFTITAVPKNERGVKTLRRLMRMQPEVQKALSVLARRRRQFDNRPTNRAGRIWIDRKKPTQVVRVLVGESFTLRVTPQIMNDLKSVEKYLEAKAA